MDNDVETLEVETALVTEPIAFEQLHPQLLGPLDSPPDDWVPGEIRVVEWLQERGGDASESARIHRVARAWFGLARGSTDAASTSRLRLVPGGVS